MQNRWLFAEPKLHSSYGILDNDYGQNRIKIENKVSCESVVILERHSLENYVYDPFVFYSTLNEEQRKDLELPIELNECDIIEELQDILLNKETIQCKVDKYFEYFKNQFLKQLTHFTQTPHN
jgi:hypothetical protein